MSLPAAFVSVVLIWSTTPLAIKWSSLGIGFSFAVFARMVIGVLLCVALLALFRIRFPMHSKARQAYIAGGVSIFAAMGFTYWSAQYVSSGMIAVIFGLSPLITSLGAMLWLEEEALTRYKVAGMLLGLLGLMMVFRGGLDLGSNAGIGIIALLCAVTAQSMGMVRIKHIGDDSPPLAMTCGSLLVSLPLFMLAWFVMDGHVPASAPQQAVAATVYLGVFGSVLGFALYYYLIKHLETGRVALITLITPVMALLLGHALNNEAILPQVWFGTASIVLGLGLHQWGGRRLSV
ncbi:MAG: DMT family transporter [Gammaproteobacteria bacterium]|nr:DMT family transporter [Gammaproteobacteria bacterium]MBU1624915.1 DMT family transporter [Gammaproteobacteria bacterium]MBU1982214.1 DMT family transporter [Gammaproteobacteria bacterium]